MKTGVIKAVNISEKKGTQKYNVHSAKLLPDWGIEHDAHAGKWHRQVSLLSYEKIEEFKAKGAPVAEGAFGENLIVSGIDLRTLPVGTVLAIGEVRLEVTQIGKQCHSGCEIYKVMGDCIMPREGIFTKVLTGGIVSEGDLVEVLEMDAGEGIPSGTDGREKAGVFTHFDSEGNAVMVDVSEKAVTRRQATARGEIHVSDAVMQAILKKTVKKGDVLGVAQIAGIMGAKQTSSLIPLCHPLAIEKCSVDFETDEAAGTITASCTVQCSGKTGVEMEALTGVQVALLTIYDMCKALDRTMEMTGVRLVEKSGGKSGHFLNPKEMEARAEL